MDNCPAADNQHTGIITIRQLQARGFKVELPAAAQPIPLVGIVCPQLRRPRRSPRRKTGASCFDKAFLPAEILRIIRNCGPRGGNQRQPGLTNRMHHAAIRDAAGEVRYKNPPQSCRHSYLASENQLTTVKRSPQVTGVTSWKIFEGNAINNPASPSRGINQLVENQRATRKRIRHCFVRRIVQEDDD